MDLKKTLKKNNDLNVLYEEINSWKPIVLEKSSDSMWGSHINDKGEAVVSYAKASNYPACLAHELLHFKMQKNGYKRMKCSVSSLEDKELSTRLIEALDNELQHHKMFILFSRMGFSNESFYFDGDAEIRKYLDKVLEEKDGTIHALITDYLTAIAPGGPLSTKEVGEYKKRFREKMGSPVVFDAIDNAIENWVSSDSYDQEDTVRDIYFLVDQPTETWIGFDNGQGFPDTGFFIENSFTIEDFTEKYT